MTESLLALSEAPPRRRKGNRREEIIAIATRCFLEQGYSGTTMSDVFERAGGSRTTLYKHFPGKIDLFSAVLRRQLETYRIDFAGVLTSRGPIAGTLRTFCEHFIGMVSSTEGIALQRLLVDASRHFSGVGAQFYSEGPVSTRALLAQFLEQRAARGQFVCRDPTEAAHVLTDMCMGATPARALWENKIPTSQTIARDSRQIVDTFLYLYSSGES